MESSRSPATSLRPPARWLHGARPPTRSPASRGRPSSTAESTRPRSSGRTSSGSHARRRPGDRVLRRRQGHDELSPGRKPRRRHGSPAHDRGRAGEDLRRRRDVLSIHGRRRAEPWEDIAAGITTARSTSASRCSSAGRRPRCRIRRRRRLHPDVDRQRRQASPNGACQFHDDPLKLRHSVQFIDWQLNPAVAPDAFTTAKAAAANKIAFSHPRMKPDTPAGAHPIGVGREEERPSQRPQIPRRTHVQERSNPIAARG